MPNAQEIIDCIEGGINEKEAQLIRDAFDFAQKAHEGQVRANGDPYFYHVFETAKIIAKLGMDSNTIAAGLMHDVLEDTEVKEETMRQKFGEDIVFMINGVTKLGRVKYRGHQRHVESLRKFFMAISKDIRIVVIKLADRLHNLRTLEHLREDKRKRIALEAIEVHAPLANRLGMGKLKGELEDAAFPYAYPTEYQFIENLINEKKEIYEDNLEEIRQTLEKELPKNGVDISEINYRLKHKYSLWRKLQRYNMDIEKVYDIVALRVVVNNIENCYRALGVVHSIWKPLPGRIKDYIALPKPNGYRSLHTTIFNKEKGIAEIQIRTKEMHAEAAYGIAAHFAYKENKEKGKNEKIKWVEELKDITVIPEGKSNKLLDHLKLDFFSDRIFIFTPKGEVIDLPESSSPIDFAYAVHSDIGDHLSGAKINGKLSQITTTLKNGDIVEIIDKKDAHPSSKWLDYAKTSLARKHIRSYLEKNSLLAKLKSFGKS